MRRAQWWAVFAIGAFAVVGCSGDSDGGAVATEPPVTICSATGAPQAEADVDPAALPDLGLDEDNVRGLCRRHDNKRRHDRTGEPASEAD